MAFAVINEDTGEIIRRIEDGDRIVKKEQSEYARTHIMNFNADKPFVKFYSNIVPSLIKHLTASEIKMVLALMPLAKWEDCTIEKTIQGYSKILSMHEIAEETGLEYQFVKRNIHSLTLKGVIAVCEIGTIFPERDSKATKVYIVNPYVFFNGKNLNNTLYQIYKNSGWEELLLENENSFTSED